MAKRTPVHTDETAAAYVVPRRWLIAIVALLTLPWLVVLALYAPARAARADVDPPPATRAPAAAATPEVTLPDGPWGSLAATRIVISPPLEQVPANWGPIESPEWRFPDSSSDVVAGFLASSGLAPADVSALMGAARTEPRIRGVILRPDPALVWRLAPDVRAAIYGQLAQTPLNPRQHDAYRYEGASPEEWLGQGAVPRDVFEIVRPLIYRQGTFLYFADIDLVRTKVTDPEALQRLAKALFRVSTMVVELRVPDGEEIDGLAEYWGRGGRRTDILPLLESVSGADTHPQIDITHLLPPTARINLYRYPKVSIEDLQRPELVNCLWTSLNFFEASPDNRLVDLAAATDTLRRRYYFVHDKFQLGDLVVLSDAPGNLLHVAVYLAADLVFTKNGTSPLSPWVIMRLDSLKGYYRQYGEGLQMQYYRRKDL